MWDILASSFQESLVVGCVYLGALLVSDWARGTRKKVSVLGFAVYALAYTAAVAALSFARSPARDAVLAFAGVLVGSKVMSVL